MFKYLFLLLTTLCLASSTWLAGQQVQPVSHSVQTSFAEHVGRVANVSQLAPKPSTTPEKKQALRQQKAAPKNFIGRGLQPVLRPELAYHGRDVVAQSAELSHVVTPDVNIDGLTSGTSPNDPTGDIGLNYYVQAVNVTDIGVFTKTGTLVQSFAANVLWAPLGFSSAGDPIVLFDQFEERWLITEFPDPNQLLVAVSETSDPLGAYNVYNFSTPDFPDYPKYAVWDDVYTVTTNEGGPDALHAYILDKAALINGSATAQIQRIELTGNVNSEAGFLVLTPVDLSGDQLSGTPPMFMRLNDATWGDAPSDAIEMYAIDVDFNNPTNTQVTNQRIFVSDYDSNPCSVNFGGQFPCIPQPNGQSLDGIPEVIMNQSHYRKFANHESIVLNFITDVDGNNLSGIRWIELRRSSPTANWTVYQEGTFTQPDGLDRFLGSMAMDASGNIALAYNVASENEFVGLRLTGRFANDPLGQMTMQEIVLAQGQSVNNSFTRMGDYSHMTIDPTDGRTFWNTAEYAAANNQINTKITAITFERLAVDLAVSELIAPVSSNNLGGNEIVSVRLSNAGLSEITSFSVSYKAGNAAIVTEQVNAAIPSGESYTHDFATRVNLANLGSTSFTVSASLTGDLNLNNNSLTKVVSHLAANDIALSGVAPSAATCSNGFDLTFDATNRGTDVINSFDLAIDVDGITTLVSWSTTIQPGETVRLSQEILGLQSGANTVIVTASNVNGAPDPVVADNSISTTINFDAASEAYTLALTLDEYPEETAWTLTDENGVVIATSQPYNQESITVYEEFCLARDVCYTFRITDSAADGLCCGYGIGNFSILDANGTAIITNDGRFTSSATEQFCVGTGCNLIATVTTSPTSEPGAADGAIMVTASGGVAPYTYSINGSTSPQVSNVFDGLTSGMYTVLVTDATGTCSTSVSTTVVACALALNITSTNPSTASANDGSITIAAAGSNGAVSYSINAGTSTQSSGTFSNLANGTYNIMVTDALGCTRTATVVLDNTVSTRAPELVGDIKLYPNPTAGVFRIDVTGLQLTDRTLPLSVYDATGKLLYGAKLTWYDGNYTGSLSLYAFPVGHYFVRFDHPKFRKLVRVARN